MTYEQEIAEIRARLAFRPAEGDRVERAYNLALEEFETALLAAHAARPAPAEALEIVDKIRSGMTTFSASGQIISDLKCAALVEAYAESRVAEMRALIDEAGGVLADFLEHDAFWPSLRKQSKDDEDLDRERRECFYARVNATLAKLRAVKETRDA